MSHRQLRDALTVTTVDLNGVAAERYCPMTTPAGTIVHFHGGGFLRIRRISQLYPRIRFEMRREVFARFSQRACCSCRND